MRLARFQKVLHSCRKGRARLRAAGREARVAPMRQRDGLDTARP